MNHFIYAKIKPNDIEIAYYKALIHTRSNGFKYANHQIVIGDFSCIQMFDEFIYIDRDHFCKLIKKPHKEIWIHNKLEHCSWGNEYESYEEYAMSKIG